MKDKEPEDLTPMEALEALSHCKELEKSIDKLKIRLMKQARPKLRVVKDETSVL